MEPVSGYPNSQDHLYLGLKPVPSQSWDFQLRARARQMKVFPQCIAEVTQTKQRKNTVKSNFNFAFLKKLLPIN